MEMSNMKNFMNIRAIFQTLKKTRKQNKNAIKQQQQQKN